MVWCGVVWCSETFTRTHPPPSSADLQHLHLGALVPVAHHSEYRQDMGGLHNWTLAGDGGAKLRAQAQTLNISPGLFRLQQEEEKAKRAQDKEKAAAAAAAAKGRRPSRSVSRTASGGGDGPASPAAAAAASSSTASTPRAAAAAATTSPAPQAE
jgi:hypothetical protein